MEAGGIKVTNAIRAKILVNALPYIQAYKDKIVVIKYGGSAMLNSELQESVIGDVILLSLIGVKVVLVHGGGPEITETLEKLGKKTEFVNGFRVTDEETVEIVQMVLAGKINKSLVNLFQKNGAQAVGICGLDGLTIEAKIKDKKLGYVGEITRINTELINDILNNGYIPVVSTIAGDAKGNTYNVNADDAAAKIAGALGAEIMISMTDISGLLKDKNDLATLIPKVVVSEIPALIKEGIVSGGMIPKIECCREAIRRGVKRVFILDGRVLHAILIEMLTDEGLGTMFVSQ